MSTQKTLFSFLKKKDNNNIIDSSQLIPIPQASNFTQDSKLI